MKTNSVKFKKIKSFSIGRLSILITIKEKKEGEISLMERLGKAASYSIHR